MEMNGHEAIIRMESISKLPGGSFNISFYSCNLTKGEASAELKTYTGCRFRLPLPQDKWETDSDNYFLFEDSAGNPKTCYKVLIRFVALSSDNFKLLKLVWV